jgi:hypothetical protein
MTVSRTEIIVQKKIAPMMIVVGLKIDSLLSTVPAGLIRFGRRQPGVETPGYSQNQSEDVEAGFPACR